MSNFAIITDSSCDLTQALRERFEIDGYIPGIVVFPDGHTEYADLDWKNITPAAFYGAMKDKKGLYSTAQIGLQDVTDRFEPFLKQGRDVLYVALSSGLSGTYNSACTVAREMKEKYPDRTVRCVDTLRYCGAEGLLVLEASRLRREGKSLEETARWLEANRLRVHQMGILEDLFFCKRMGRVSGAAAVMGTLVGIRPLADIAENGISTVIGKAKGKKNALNATIAYMRRTIEKPEEQIIFISQSERPEAAEELKRMIQAEFHPREVVILTVCQSCGVSIGPGLYAAFYLGKPISKDLEAERKLVAEITGKG